VSLHLASLTLGSALVFLVTPLLLPLLSWRVLLRLYALAGAAVLVPFFFLLRQAGAEPHRAPRRERSRLERPAVPVVALLCAVLFVTLFQIGGGLTWLPPWLQERGGFSPLQTGLASMTFSLVGIPSTLLGGWLADRPGGRRGLRIIGLSLVGVLVSSTVLALGWLQDARWFALVLLVIVLARWGSFMAVGPLLSLVPRLAPPGGQGSLLGLVNAVTMSGSVAASFAGGLAIQLTGGYRALWVLFSAALLASAAVLHPLLRRCWLALFPGDAEAPAAR
jgi:predicted MFS family arabinose efflux permease